MYRRSVWLSLFADNVRSKFERRRRRRIPPAGRVFDCHDGCGGDLPLPAVFKMLGEQVNSLFATSKPTNIPEYALTLEIRFLFNRSLAGFTLNLGEKNSSKKPNSREHVS